MTVPSPCISICKIDEKTGYCLGCFRTSQEVADWLYLDDERKKAVLEALKARKN